jgi:hypothetical protein
VTAREIHGRERDRERPSPIAAFHEAEISLARLEREASFVESDEFAEPEYQERSHDRERDYEQSLSVLEVDVMHIE